MTAAVRYPEGGKPCAPSDAFAFFVAYSPEVKNDMNYRWVMLFEQSFFIQDEIFPLLIS